MSAFEGSTSELFRVGDGIVLKQPRVILRASKLYDNLTRGIDTSFSVEQQILEILDHPRIVRYLGRNNGQGDPRGILLAEANHGNLQRYLDEHSKIPMSVRKSWCLQAVEAIAYIHHRGVIHSDLRPENFLIHATTPGTLDMLLCDFGGSTCDRLGLDGGHLPDPGFYDPNSGAESTHQTDIFSIASVLYVILTGHWPYRGPGPFKTGKEMEDYGLEVDDLFERGRFPDVDGLFAGEVILKCWRNEYASADDVLDDVRKLM
ncbi:Protein kinase-like domain protein [Ophiocordyceps sinensis CO18]|uniref:EKC/KEOPS complex subunit BUD32 n=1 Tax=Ophiocordyceps sinensis (strain Co18 / CGMCC 3.14243) TaxID=911162 RepID=T5A9F3_OPHSC|nr:Protein kinase-like domain protein [Ophiocordyceps sinensis CO18]